ncbi:hypothetical protein GGR50DRAFT_96087 [Xylaria sp. CBS 124048]|nr:hypothetical protein GGR50DRAFT_96087 [Xylaria sp. CBS 124048]
MSNATQPEDLYKPTCAVAMENQVELHSLSKARRALTLKRARIASLRRLYIWPLSQFYHLHNFAIKAMEQTSSLITKLHGDRDPNFPRFSQLPPELRIKIWQYAMPEARTVVVKARQRRLPASLDEALPQGLDVGETWQSTTQIPALLHVNAEARHEALKHYTLSLGVGEEAPRVYIDFKHDTLFFGDAELQPERMSLWTATKGLEKILYLATVPEGAWRVLRWTKFGLHSLQKLIFVHETEKIKLGSSPELVEDQQPETEPSVEVEIKSNTQQGETNTPWTQADPESPRKKRAQAAKEELETLVRISPTQWEQELAISTAVFKKNRGDRWHVSRANRHMR